MPLITGTRLGCRSPKLRCRSGEGNQAQAMGRGFVTQLPFNKRFLRNEIS
jgi:hypothetical protein